MLFEKTKSDMVADNLVGIEFEKAGRGKKLDCMGVIIQYYGEFGISIPDYSNIKDWGEYDEEYIKAYPRILRRLDDNEVPEIGDIIIFKKTFEMTGTLNHAGIFLGDGKFIHACRTVGTRIDNLWDRTWKNKIYGYFRLRDRNAKTDQGISRNI